jgi:hypothetical protein
LRDKRPLAAADFNQSARDETLNGGANGGAANGVLRDKAIFSWQARARRQRAACHGPDQQLLYLSVQRQMRFRVYLHGDIMTS